MSPSKDAIILILPQHVLVAGQTFRGEVELDFNVLQKDEIQEVHVKLRGTVETRLTRQNYQGQQQQHPQPRTTTEYETRELVREDVSLWTKGSVYPPPGTHLLRFPFEFRLPPGLPPSCHHDSYRGRGVVAYMVEAVGVRDGTFSFNRRVAEAISVVPADPTGAQVKQVIQTGWNGRWQAVQEEDQIRRGLWGGYAKVHIQLSFPGVDIFPLFTDIPFTLQITTTTKEMKYSDSPDDPTEPVFPAPPTHPHEVELMLRSQTRVSSRFRSAESTDDVFKVGGMGVEDKSGGTSGVEVVVRPREWLPSPDNNEKGSWKQETNMRSILNLKCTPTFSYPIMSLDYFLHLKVSFPGIGNSTRIDFPLVLGSGLVVPSAQPVQGIGYAPEYVTPMPQLDLPPAYWSHTDWVEDKN